MQDSAKHNVAWVTDPDLDSWLRSDRAARGVDRWDEVWDGVHVITPPRDDLHQEITTGLAAMFLWALKPSKAWKVRAGVNISDRENWRLNYRCPDVVVFAETTSAENRSDFWLGGADFMVEVVSKDDRTRRKLPFYAKVGTRELLIIDREPWQLELFRLSNAELISVGQSRVDDGPTLASEVVPFTFRLVGGEGRPMVAVTHTAEGQTWKV